MPQSRKQPEGPRTQQGEAAARRRRRLHWGWPVGLAVAGIGSAAAFMLRGCWHAHMSWPVRHDDEFSYQVCPGCGIKRLFDVTSFRAYGPYGYDLHELIARERAARIERLRRHNARIAAKEQAAEKTRLEQE